MTTLLLIRHAMTDAVGRWIAGSLPGCNLNDTGRQQAEKLAGHLAGYPIAMVYSSPLERTVETAAVIARRHGREPRVDPDLAEVQFGEWEGRSFEDLRDDPQWQEFNQRRGSARAPQGESMLDVQARIMRALEHIVQSHPNETVAVVSHGDPLRVALAGFLGMPVDLFTRFEVSPASISIVECNSTHPRVFCLNYRVEAVQQQ